MIEAHGWARVIAGVGVALGVLALWWLVTVVAIEAIHGWQWRRRARPGYPARRSGRGE